MSGHKDKRHNSRPKTPRQFVATKAQSPQFPLDEGPPTEAQLAAIRRVSRYVKAGRLGGSLFPEDHREAERKKRLLKRDSAALRAYFAIAERLGLSSAQASKLLAQRGPTARLWRREVRNGQLTLPLPQEALFRVSYLLGIWKVATILFARPSVRRHWIHAPNSLFGGRSPLSFALANGELGLKTVRHELEAAVRGISSEELTATKMAGFAKRYDEMFDNMQKRSQWALQRNRPRSRHRSVRRGRW